jgi:hypothetical protein
VSLLPFSDFDTIPRHFLEWIGQQKPLNTAVEEAPRLRAYDKGLWGRARAAPESATETQDVMETLHRMNAMSLLLNLRRKEEVVVYL